MMQRTRERAGLLAWRKKIDERLKELDLLDEADHQPPVDDVRQIARRDPRFAQWERERILGGRR